MEINPQIKPIVEYLYCSEKIFYWLYDHEGSLCLSNCELRFFNLAFSGSGSLDYVLNQYNNYRYPLILHHDNGTIWIAVFETDKEQLKYVHVFGPFISSRMDVNQLMENIIHYDHGITDKFQKKIYQYLALVPNVQVYTLYQQILMIHYILNHQLIQLSDLVVKKGDRISQKQFKASEEDTLAFYHLEQKLLKDIENGNLNYQDDYRAYESIFKINKDVQHNDFNNNIVFISLCTRAAIAGNLSADYAYHIGSHYLNLLSSAGSSLQDRDLLREMVAEFVNKVHQAKIGSRYSAPIQSTIDYIESNIEQPLDISRLACRIGYSDYYLSRKFKNETGCSIGDYIKKEKINEARSLLENSDLTVSAIADTLSFESRSHFVSTFNKLTGCSPSAYRKQYKKY